MGEAVPLFTAADQRKAKAWYCTGCRRIYSQKEDAEKCTGKGCNEWTCISCGKPTFGAHYQYCADCQHKLDHELEVELLAKAEAIPAWAYPDDIGVVYDGEYYQCLNDFIDHCEQEGFDIPDRVWATKPSVFSLDADRILDFAWEEWSDGCEDVDRGQIVGEEALREAIRVFNESQKATLYFECKAAVDLGGKEESNGW